MSTLFTINVYLLYVGCRQIIDWSRAKTVDQVDGVILELLGNTDVHEIPAFKSGGTFGYHYADFTCPRLGALRLEVYLGNLEEEL